jgi:hypothetical protein
MDAARGNRLMTLKKILLDLALTTALVAPPAMGPRAMR